MANKSGPRFKECRRLGVNVCGHPKAMNRYGKTGSGTGRRPKKMSEYALQLTEKQKIKAYYGIFERQMRNYFEKASRSREGKSGEILLVTLECRLDNLVYRMGFANSIRLARQMVTHRHIKVNGEIVNIPSFQVKVGDTLSLKEKSRKIEHFTELFEAGGFGLPYIETDQEKYQGVLTRLPLRDELPIEVNEQLVVEYYSR